MALFLTIIAFSIASIVLLLLTLNGIVPYGQSSIFLIPLLFKILFFLILAGSLS